MERIVINVETGEQSVVPFTEEEIAQMQTQQEQFEAEQAQINAAKEAQQLAKQSALNKLTALGLNEQEIKAILNI